jgi:hypothetical protein
VTVNPFLIIFIKNINFIKIKIGIKVEVEIVIKIGIPVELFPTISYI